MIATEIDELIQQARELCEKATPGPWEAKTTRYPECNGEPWGWISGASRNITWSGNSGQVNASFIAASRCNIYLYLQLVMSWILEIGKM